MVVKKNEATNDDLFLTLGLGYPFLGQRMNELVLANRRWKGLEGLRISHEYIIQHLVETSEPVARTGTDLARCMGIRQEAASKTSAELVRLGVVEVAESDRRVKEVRLSARGWEGVRYARSSRARLKKKLARHVGAQTYSDAKETLQASLQLVGGVEPIRSRRVRQPN